MRLTRHLSAAAVAAGLGLTAGVLTAGSASAATTPDPDVRSFLNGPVCSGDTLSGVVRVYSLTNKAVPGSVELRYNAGGNVYPSSAIRKQFTVSSRGSRDYAFSFNLAGLPRSATQLRAYALVGDPAKPVDTLLSKVVLVSSCAPAEVIPEAPHPALIPLTLAGTAGIVVATGRRRRAQEQRAA